MNRRDSRTVLITGATNGIGRATATAAAAAGHHLLLAVRDTRRGDALRAELGRATGNRSVEVFRCDLADRASVAQCAAAVLERHAQLDVLINNAGTLQRTPRLSESGHELTFATNHLGPYQLTLRLLPLLRSAAAGRIVNVASTLHQRAALDPAALTTLENYGMFNAYARSKLANVLFTLALARREAEGPVRVNCLHPGAVASNILPGDSAPWRWLDRAAKALRVLTPPERGAATSLYLAFDPAAAEMHGLYLDEHQIPQPCAAAARDEALQEDLWRLSAAATGVG